MSVLFECTSLITKNCKKTSSKKNEFIIVHYQGCIASAKSIANYFYKTSNKVSSHFVVDEKGAYKCVPVEYIAWHCATSTIKNPLCKNTNSIGVDVIATKLNKKSCSANDNDWYVTEGTWKNATMLIAELCVNYNIPITNVVRHYDVTGKLCPRQFCTDNVNLKTGHTGNEDWNLFKAEIEKQIGLLTVN